MLSGILTVIHVLICLVLIVVVLMQSQQSMNISGMFGGASQSALGNRPESMLSRATTVLAIIFMLTSVGFALWPSGNENVLEGGQQQQAVPSAGQQQTPQPADQGEAQAPEPGGNNEGQAQPSEPSPGS